MTSLLKHRFGLPPKSPKGSLKASPGARSSVIPKREPSWAYRRYLERKQKQLNQQVFIWTGIAFLCTFALLAISTLASWS